MTREWLIQTYEDDLMIKADTCEIINDKLVFTVDGEVECVFAEWVLCSVCHEPPLKAVK
jgi:hypothetical protein